MRTSASGVRCTSLYYILSTDKRAHITGELNECKGMGTRLRSHSQFKLVYYCLCNDTILKNPFLMNFTSLARSLSLPRLNVARTLPAILSTFDFCVIPNLLSCNSSLSLSHAHERTVSHSFCVPFTLEHSSRSVSAFNDHKQPNDIINLYLALENVRFQIELFLTFSR